MAFNFMLKDHLATLKLWNNKHAGQKEPLSYLAHPPKASLLYALCIYSANIYCILGGSAGKESTCNVGALGLIPELGRSPEEENRYPLQ